MIVLKEKRSLVHSEAIAIVLGRFLHFTIALVFFFFKESKFLGFGILSLTRKVIGFKSLQLNCSDINQNNIKI